MNPGILDQVTQQFLMALQQDAHWIEQAAWRLFFYLSVIQLSMTALWQVLAGASLQRLVADLVKLAFVLGFFYALIDYGGEWIPAIINGFMGIGQQSALQSLSPSAVVSQGVALSGAIIHGFFQVGLLSHLFIALMGVIISLSICVIYALIAAELAIVLVKSYVLAASSGLFFAFGASESTRPMSLNYLRAVIGIGLQLMTLYFLLGVGQHVGENWAKLAAIAVAEHQLTPLLIILTAVIVYYLILRNIPSFIASLAGVGSFKNDGVAAASLAIQAANQSVKLASKTAQLSGKTVQAGFQTIQGGAHIAKSMQQGFQQAEGSIVTRTAAGVASGAMHTAAAIKEHLVRESRGR